MSPMTVVVGVLCGAVIGYVLGVAVSADYLIRPLIEYCSR